VLVVPPDGADRVGMYDWTLINPSVGSASVDLVDDPGKAVGDGFAFGPGDPVVRLTEANDAGVWAAAGGSAASLQVLGVSRA
jgi:hypothetical protein